MLIMFSGLFLVVFAISLRTDFQFVFGAQGILLLEKKKLERRNIPPNDLRFVPAMREETT